MKIITPGRICLFGEHQDYLGLPVIALAISLRSSITATKRRDKKIIIPRSNFIFQKKDIVIAKKDLDITNPVMDLLNNKLKKIDF